MSAKLEVYVVKKKGETLGAIAKQYGFSDWKVVWNDRANEGLRKTRKVPEQLAVGDKIVIPTNPADAKKAQDELKRIQEVLERLRKVRAESETCFDKMEAELDKDFKKINNLADGLDVAAMVATAFVGAAFEGAKILQGAKAAQAATAKAAVAGAAKIAVLEVAVGIAEPSWWAGHVTKWITGEDNETAYKNARAQLLKAKANSLKNLDLKIHDYERLKKEAGG
ncbi:MAG TPA: LysM peptidoglycan-binding domain-containing protein [Planctomycetota bacterium]|nr:LysM peptidoglycan-binding domain-containing protein [Planctomycetota bacterium]